MTVGLAPPQDSFPFRKWLKPGETWESPWVFLVPYEGTHDPYAAVNGPVNAFVRRHMGVRLAEAKRKPVLVYNRSKVYREHPEWFVRDDAGRPVNLHEEPGGVRSA